MARPKLKKGDISLWEMYELSVDVYGSEVDNKLTRADIDIISAKRTMMNNMQKVRGQWKQTGRNVKLEFLVKTKPISYKKNDTVKTHVFPVVFLIRNINDGLNSAFRWRTGSWSMPKFPRRKISEGKNKKEKDQIRKENLGITNTNIRNGIQLQFFFDLEMVLDLYGLLYGPNRTNRNLPKTKNPKLIPFFDKHALFIFETFIVPLLTTHKQLLGEVD